MSQEVINWADKLANEAKEVAALERPALSQISTKGGFLRYQDQAIPGNKLACIVIASAFENRYYKNKWDPNKRENPTCWALSIDGENMAPNPDHVKEPPAEDCASCPNGMWGSAGEGSKGKACKNIRRLGLIPSSSVKDGNAKTAEVALLSVPVTSAKNWANYVNQCSAEFARPPWALITEVYTEPDPKTQFQIKFRTLSLINDDMLGDLHSRIPGIQDILLAPYDTTGNIEGSYPGESADTTKNRKY
jgi:hypothetical protein